MYDANEFFGEGVEQKRWNPNRHCYEIVIVYSPGRAVKRRASVKRESLTLARRLYLFLKRHGPQTARQLAQILLGNVKNKSLVRIVTELSKDQERFVIVGTIKIKGVDRNLWGIRGE